jgi:hypothetical protein
LSREKNRAGEHKGSGKKGIQFIILENIDLTRNPTIMVVEIDRCHRRGIFRPARREMEVKENGKKNEKKAQKCLTNKDFSYKIENLKCPRSSGGRAHPW